MRPSLSRQLGEPPDSPLYPLLAVCLLSSMASSFWSSSPQRYLSSMTSYTPGVSSQQEEVGLGYPGYSSAPDPASFASWPSECRNDTCPTPVLNQLLPQLAVCMTSLQRRKLKWIIEKPILKTK